MNNLNHYSINKVNQQASGSSRNRMSSQHFNSNDEQAVHTGSTLQRLFGYMKGMQSSLFLVILLSALSSISQALAPVFIGTAVDSLKDFMTDKVLYSKAASILTISMLSVLSLYVFGWLTNAISRYALVKVGTKLLLKLRSEIMAKVQTLSINYFDRHEAGDLLSRLTNDTDVIGRVVGMGLSRLLTSFLLLIAILTGMTILNWRLALATFALLPFMYISTALFSKRARKEFRKTRKTISGVSSELEQNISGAKITQAFNRQSQNSTNFQTLNRANREANVGAESVTAAFAPTMDIISAVGIAIILGYGGYLSQTGQISIGIIVAFLQYIRRFFEPVRAISMIWGQVQSAVAGSERIFQLLDESVDVVDDASAKKLVITDGKVSLNNVFFHYANGKPVLQGINLTAEPGQTIALVGSTGAGKTTIISLIERFYDVINGSIIIDGQDIRHVTQQSLRSNIGIVLQDTFLFADTIKNNIKYGNPEVEEEKIIMAARQARAHEFINELPQKYETILQEGAENLSRGQRQLLCIARALLKDPKILILDEATSNVDTKTELLIQEALQQLLRNRTSFVVAHRLSTIKRADIIYVIHQGKIIEKGTHDDLLSLNGEYHHIYQSQFAK